MPWIQRFITNRRLVLSVIIFSVVIVTITALFLYGQQNRPGANPLNAIGQGKSHFVSPTGSASGSGTEESPWDLQTALNHPSGVKPGDTIWVKGGTYLGPFVSKLEGTAAAPIVVRNYNGERVILDLNRTTGNNLRGFRVEGQGAWFWGLELLDSSLERNTSEDGSDPRSIPRERSAIMTYGDNIKFINTMIHDLGDGYGMWVQAENTELYGSISFNNGWNSPYRGHGHGFYTQNLNGTKVIRHHVSFNNFGTGGKAYGVQGQTTGYLFDGLIHFNNGSPSALLRNNPAYREPNLLVGGEHYTSDRISVINSYFYEPAHTLGGSQGIGYLAKPNGRAVVRNNYFMGGPTGFGISHYSSAEVTDNVFFSRSREAARNSDELLLSIRPADGIGPSAFTVDRNTYYDLTRRSGDIYAPFRFTGFKNAYGSVALPWIDWQQKTGLDKQSTYKREAPSETTVHLQPNHYEKGRAHIVVYNWAGQDSVSVDLTSSGLSKGEEFEIYDVQNIFGDPVYQGMYAGLPIELSLSNRTVTIPIGMNEAPTHTLPEFGVYLVMPKEFKSHQVDSGDSGSGSSDQQTQITPTPTEISDDTAHEPSSRPVTLRYRLQHQADQGSSAKLALTFIPIGRVTDAVTIVPDQVEPSKSFTHAEIDRLAAGMYQVAVKPPLALSQLVEVTVGQAGEVSLTYDQPFLNIDINNDDIINNADWFYMLKHWLTSSSLVDFNADGTVNNVDASYMLNQWFARGKRLELEGDVLDQ